MEQLVVLLVFGAISLLSWLFKRKEEEQDSQAPPPLPRSQPRQVMPGTPESDEERMRRFMEALGLPATTERSPQPARRPQQRQPRPSQGPAPAARREPPQLPPVVEPPRTAIVQPPVVAEHEPETFTVTVTPALSEQVPESAQILMHAVPSALGELKMSGEAEAKFDPQSVRAMVRGRAALRRAIVLNAVLGPPRGLQIDGGAHSFP